MRGKTDDFKTVVLPGGEADVGKMCTVRIVRASAHTLVADGVVEGALEESTLET